MTDAQAALAQVREALAARPTPGQWFAVNDGNRTEPFMNVKAERISGRGPTHEVAICATGDSPQSMETANARYIAACSPVNIAAILAHVEAVEIENAHIWGSNKELTAELERLTAAAQHEADCVEAYRAQVEMVIRERDELCRQLAEAELDAQRYRDWLRGGENIPPESTRWARWEVRHWDGRYWNTLFAEALDTSIDAAMDLTRPAEES